MKNTKLTIGIVVIIAIVLIGVFFIFNSGIENQDQDIETDTTTPDEQEPVIEQQLCNPAEKGQNWRDIEFQDVETGECLTISQFSGEKLFLESFAVWCPTCKQQQDRIQTLEQENPGLISSISFDTDFQEDVEQVIEHKNEHGYDWIFTLSPKELTESLIDEFGISVVNAPGAPVVLICEDQSARLLPRGLKSVEKLKEEIEAGC